MAVAAGVTFYALLSIFPAIAAFVSLYGLIGDPGKIQGYLDTMKEILPGGAIEVVASKGGSALGLGLIIGLATALWSANAGVKAMKDLQYRKERTDKAGRRNTGPRSSDELPAAEAPHSRREAATWI